MYHLVVEAALAQPGQHFIESYLTDRGLLPGFAGGMKNVSLDEQRHIGFGVKVLSELIREDAECKEAVAELQPVISQESLERIMRAVDDARAAGARILSGGERLERAGWFLAATVVEGVRPDAPISRTELFGPVTVLYRASDLDAAIELVNDSPYGLTAAIHTASVHRAMQFAERVAAGVVVVNAGTHGSEPHMGFGGVKQSGTGWKEAGLESLDVYSETRYVNLVVDPART